MKNLTNRKTTFRSIWAILALTVILAGVAHTKAVAYCNPTMYASNPCNYLNSVTTSGGLTNITVPVDAGYNGTGYTYFSSPVISQNQGASFTLTCQAAGTCGISYYFVWVDWDQSGVFDPAEMVVNNGATNTANNATSFTINVPAGAVVGNTRIRILCRGTGAPIPATACDNESGYYGETEDYSLSVMSPSPCTGTPAPGTTLSSVASACPNITFVLSLQNPTAGSGVTYQWQSSANGVTYTNIGGATSPTYSAAQTSATYYQCVVTCSAGPSSGTSAPVQVTMNPFTSCYCIPTTTNGCLAGDHVTNVTFAGINNTTGTCLVNSYSDYTGTAAASATVGLNYPMTVHVNNGGTEYAGAWIDYDHSGTFDAGEYITLSGVLGTDWIFTGSVTIPVSALTGTTRLRVRSSYALNVASNSACATYSYGETEDYTINIIPGAYDMGILNLAAPVSPSCYTSTEYVTATVKNFGTAAIDLSIHPVTVSGSVTGPNPMTFTNVILNTGTIAVGATQLVNLSTTYNMSAAGTYTFTTATSVSGDATTGNDTYSNSYIKYTDPTVVATPNTVALCAGQSTNILASGNSGIGIISYTWSPGAGLSSTSSQFPLATPASTTTYSVTVVDVAGCSAMDTALITVHQLPTVTANASTTTPCTGSNFTLFGGGASSYLWDNGVTDNVPFAATTMITYNVTGTDIYGCSNTSSIIINPNALPVVSAMASLTPICMGNMETLTGSGAVSYVWDNGVTNNVAFAANSTTTYNVTGTDANGCIGTAAVTVTVKPLATHTQSVTICHGTSLTVGSSTYSTSGAYTNVFTAANGCDSTLTTNLTVSAAITGSQSIDVCAGGSVSIGGTVHTTSGTYTDVLTGGAMNGCDSTVTTMLTVDAAITGSQSVTVCSGGSITIAGNTHNATGTYTDVITAGAMNGCDSTVTTNLTVSPTIMASQAITVCAGGSITVGSSTYNSSGTYTDVFANGAMNGCDSTIVTNLTVSAAVTGSQTITLCNGGMLMVGSSMYTSSGTYTDVLPGAAMSGCDSTVTSNLTILNPIIGSQVLNMCSGGMVTVGGNTYTSTGIYTDVLAGASVAGCDSIVTTNLTVNSSITTNQTLTICAGDSILVGTVHYHTTGVYTDSLTALAGCDSVITTNLTVALPLMSTQTLTICAGTSLTVGTMTYTTTGVYTDVLTGMVGCDSTVTTNLTVSPAITGSQSVTLCYGGSLTVGSNTYSASGSYIDVLTAMSGCDSIVTTTLNINGQIPLTVNSPTICAGQTANLVANGATSYTWSAGITPTGANTATASPASTQVYHVTGTVGTCADTATITITVHPVPVVTMAAFNPASVCINWAAFALPATTPFGGIYSGAGVTTGNMFTPSIAGAGAHVITYTFTDTNTTCSASATQTVTVNSCAGVDEYSLANSVVVYPNPTNGLFTIAISNADFTELVITITDIEGRIVYYKSDKNNGSEYSKQINLEGLAKGIYYIKVSNTKETAIQKLVIE